MTSTRNARLTPSDDREAPLEPILRPQAWFLLWLVGKTVMDRPFFQPIKIETPRYHRIAPWGSAILLNM